MAETTRQASCQLREQEPPAVDFLPELRVDKIPNVIAQVFVAMPTTDASHSET
jgi:hypothetical protein